MSDAPQSGTPAVLRKMMARDMPREVAPVPRYDDYAPEGDRVRLHKLADELDRSKLDEIKWRFKNLSYGEMVELAEGIGADAAKIWAWATV
jgi:hypothetical protein